ncbi:MAG: ABC transporter permease [Candidatus Humimicrobiaceae bacterium]
MGKILQSVRSISVVTEKNIRIYYSKPPVIIFGLLFPFFMFLAFLLGRQVDLYNFFPGFIAMSLFFTSSSVGPLITPWEKTAGTYERLLSFPVTISTMILGDTIAGMIFGIGLNAILVTVGIFALGYSVNILILILGIIVSAFVFSCLGVFLASPSSKNPSNIMMLSSIIRFPLIFISGIFIPLEQLPLAGRILSYFSPITYLVDIFNYSLKGTHNINLGIDFLALIAFAAVFLIFANIFHKKNLLKGL